MSEVEAMGVNCRGARAEQQQPVVEWLCTSNGCSRTRQLLIYGFWSPTKWVSLGLSALEFCEERVRADTVAPSRFYPITSSPDDFETCHQQFSRFEKGC